MVTLAIRTPLTKAVKGGFKDTSLDYIVYSVLKQLVERSHLDPALIEDVSLGNVSPFSFSVASTARERVWYL